MVYVSKFIWSLSLLVEWFQIDENFIKFQKTKEVTKVIEGLHFTLFYETIREDAVWMVSWIRKHSSKIQFIFVIIWSNTYMHISSINNIIFIQNNCMTLKSIENWKYQRAEILEKENSSDLVTKIFRRKVVYY